MQRVFVLLFFLLSVAGTKEGTYCEKNGIPGLCTRVSQCPTAIQDIKSGKKPQDCGFSTALRQPIVCCVASVDANAATTPTINSMERLVSAASVKNIAPELDYEDVTERRTSKPPSSPTASIISLNAYNH